MSNSYFISTGVTGYPQNNKSQVSWRLKFPSKPRKRCLVARELLGKFPAIGLFPFSLENLPDFWGSIGPSTGVAPQLSLWYKNHMQLEKDMEMPI